MKNSTQEHIRFLEEAIQKLEEKKKKVKTHLEINILNCAIKNRLNQIDGIKLSEL